MWAGGAILFLLLQGLAYQRFLKRLSLPMQDAGDHAGIPMLQSEGVDGPLAIGLLNRRIIVPAGFEQRYTPAERQLALDHELYHHRRGDMLVNHVALVVLALNWFNPVAWIAFRAFRADQELSCDAAIAGGASPEARSDYARALVKSASRPGLIAACPLNRADQLKRRLKMLNYHKNSRRRFWAGSAVTAALVATSLSFGTAGHAQDKADGRQQERVIILESKAGAAPTIGERRRFRIERGADGKTKIEGLDAEMAARLEECRGEQGVLNLDSGEGKDRARVMVCTKDGANPANRAQVLQGVRERISAQSDLSAETKQRILAEIDRALGAARSN